MVEALKFSPEDPKREKARQEFLERTRELLDWSEEIPEKQIPTVGQKSHLKYKIRDSWFSNVLVLAELARDENLLSETTRSRYREVFRKFNGMPRAQNREEIGRAHV